MGQYELIFSIFLFVILIYGIVLGIKFLLSKTGKSDKDIVERSKERKDIK